MANKKLFKSAGMVVPVANAVNAAGGVAYSRTDEAALAQLACTGTFNGTYYASGDATLADVLSRAQAVRPEFLAKLAVYARTSGFMKDAPAVLLAVLMNKDMSLFKKAFPKVVDNGKMLRTFMQVVRSGQTGRKSFGTGPKKMIQRWLEARTDRQLFEDSVGNEPSLVDVLKMVHPKPATPAREAFYAYLMGREPKDASLIPTVAKDFEAFKKAAPGNRTVPNVPFQLLTAQDLSNKEWTAIATTAKWHMTRMNLNTFERHGVFKDEKMVKMIADRLASVEDVKASKVFPYQLFTAYKHAGPEVPSRVKNALQSAMEVATLNVPKFTGKVYVGVDYSGSMEAPVTGTRGTATTVVSCNEVASLMAACVLRNSDDCTVYRFDTSAQLISLNPRDSVITNATKIGANGGGTDCGAMLRTMNASKARADVVIVLSDTESWSNQYSHSASNLMTEWHAFKRRNPRAKLVCVDLAANTTTQAKSGKDVLNVGGFSDHVFEVVNTFLSGESSDDHWIDKIMAQEF